MRSSENEHDGLHGPRDEEGKSLRGGDLLRVQKDKSLHSCCLVTNSKHSNDDNIPLHNIIPRVLPPGNLESITVTLVIREAADVRQTKN